MGDGTRNRAWLKRMADAEDAVGGSVSVGGLAVDVGFPVVGEAVAWELWEEAYGPPHRVKDTRSRREMEYWVSAELAEGCRRWAVPLYHRAGGPKKPATGGPDV